MNDINCKCPACGGYTVRIRRRRIDRLTSIFTPVYRFRCQFYYCQWQGNIPVSKLQKTSRQLFN